MSYGTPDEVGALARVWSDDGHWVDANEDYAIRGTNPTLTTVNVWLENLSAQMDIALGTSWFNAPVSQGSHPGPYNAISQYVCELAANLARLANGQEGTVSSTGKTLEMMMKWVELNADGLIAGGLSQTPTPSKKTQASFRIVGTI